MFPSPSFERACMYVKTMYIYSTYQGIRYVHKEVGTEGGQCREMAKFPIQKPEAGMTLQLQFLCLTKKEVAINQAQ